jgi:hypothetical protein
MVSYHLPSKGLELPLLLLKRAKQGIQWNRESGFDVALVPRRQTSIAKCFARWLCWDLKHPMVVDFLLVFVGRLGIQVFGC